jgi:hypothetical protein
LIYFSHLPDSFIGVVFPTRFLGLMTGEFDHNSRIYGYRVFRSLSLESFCSLRKQPYSSLKVSNVVYYENWDSELGYLESLHKSRKNSSYSNSVHGKLGRICFGLDPFGDYVAPNLRKIAGTISRNTIISLGSFSLYQLESLKDLPSSTGYPIVYRYDFAGTFCTLIEGVHDSRDFFKRKDYRDFRTFIEIGFRNPKDIMIHPTRNQFKYWSDMFLTRLGINIYRHV